MSKRKRKGKGLNTKQEVTPSPASFPDSQRIDTVVAKNETQGKEGRTPERPSSKLRDANWWMVGITILVGFVSLLQYCTARDTLMTGSRAYFIPKEAQIYVPNASGSEEYLKLVRPMLRPGDRPSLEVEHTNSGTTPAYAVTPKTLLELRDNFPPDDFDWSKHSITTAKTKRPVAKDGTFNTGFLFHRQLTKGDIDGIYERVPGGYRKYLVIFGMIAYRDVFKTNRTTRFCFFYNPETNDMSGCETHNIAE